MGMSMKSILFLKDELYICSEECEHYDKGFGLYDPA
jgi:hypothetical protein